jgi:uncharacterized protein (UPF0335 family)
MPRKRPNPETPPAIGDNSALNAADRDKLKNLVDRIVGLEDERAGLAEDVRSVYLEAKSAGFNATALREIVRRRRQKPEQREASRAEAGRNRRLHGGAGWALRSAARPSSARARSAGLVRPV